MALRTHPKAYCKAAAVAFLLLWGSLLPILPIYAADRAVRVGVASAPLNLDARFATDAASARILRLVAPGLVRMNTAFEPVPVVASRITHEGYQTFHIELRPLKFHDGTPLTADHVKAYFENVRDAQTGSPFKGSLRDVDEISVIGENSLTITLKTPNPWFYNVLELPIMKIEADGSAKMGLGPYRIARHKKDGRVELMPRESGWKSLEIIPIKDPVVRLLKLEKGDVDILHNDLPTELFDYGKERGMKALSTPSSSYTYIGFHLQKGVSAQPAVRQAIFYAINRPQIIQTLLGGQGAPASSLLMPSHPAYAAPLENEGYNPQKAEDLLDNAGLPRGENGERFSLDLAVTTSPFILRVAQVIQRDLGAVGIRVNIRSSEWGTFYGNIKKGNFHSYILTWVGRFQPDIYHSIFHSSMMPPAGVNRGRYHNAQMDSVLDDMMHEVDDTRRRELARTVQQIQAEEMLYVPLWRRHHNALVSPNIHGYVLPEDGGYEGLLHIK